MVEEDFPKKEITPEQIMGYIYAVLNHTTYLREFKDFLKSEFPRIPLVKNYKSFHSLSILGTELINLHLMKTTFPKDVSYFHGKGDNEISKVNTKIKKFS